MQLTLLATAFIIKYYPEQIVKFRFKNLLVSTTAFHGIYFVTTTFQTPSSHRKDGRQIPTEKTWHRWNKKPWHEGIWTKKHYKTTSWYERKSLGKKIDHGLKVPSSSSSTWGSCSRVRPHGRWIMWASPTLVLGSYPSGMERHHATSAIICRDVPLEGIQETAYNAGVWKNIGILEFDFVFFQRIPWIAFLCHTCRVFLCRFAANQWDAGNPATLVACFPWGWLKSRVLTGSQKLVIESYSVLVNHFEAFWAINHININFIYVITIIKLQFFV